MKMKKYKETELLELKELPKEFITLKNDRTKKDMLCGLKINYQIQQIVRDELKTGGFSKTEKWNGSYTNCTGTNYFQPEKLIMALIIECLEKTVHPKLILHRLTRELNNFTGENPLKNLKEKK